MIAGKWVYHEKPEQLAELASELSGLILEGLTSEIKFRPTPNDTDGPFSHLAPPMCIFSSNQNKNELEDRVLQKVDSIYWQSNEATEQLHKDILLRK